MGIMFGKEAFSEGLKQLGYDPEDRGNNRVAFKYKIGAGRFKDTVITIGIEVPPDFNVTCPTGPHISPRLIPINTSATGNDRAAESPQFGPEWQYLSRPFVDQNAGWNRTSRNVKAYMRHIKRVLETL
jgi:hypothetical protein